MATLKSLTLISAFTVVLVISGSSVTNAVPAEVIDQICKKYTDNKFCRTWIGNEPRASTARDMQAMDLLCLSLTNSKVEDGLNAMDKAGQSADEIGKRRLRACKSYLNNASDRFREAWKAANSKSYKQVADLVGQGKVMVSSCDNLYKTFPVKPSPIGDFTLTALKLADISLIVNGMAQGH